MMDDSKRTQSCKGSAHVIPTSTAVTSSFRNLKKTHLAGVIFGCTDLTITECLSKQLFGLPLPHFSYVKNIEPGLALFLFNYSNRVLHGIFEAAGPGQMNIDLYGWTADGSRRTAYPAQVRVHVRKHCNPLGENQYAPIIKDNFYTTNHFWFELDHAQVCKLISMFSNQVVKVAPTASVLKNMGNWPKINCLAPKLKTNDEIGIDPSVAQVDSSSCNQLNGHLGFRDPNSYLEGSHQSLGAVIEDMEMAETQRIYEKLQKLATCEPSDSSPGSQVKEHSDSYEIQTEVDGSCKTDSTQEENLNVNALAVSDFPFVIAQLMREVQELKAFKEEHIQKMSQLEQKLAISESEVQHLKDHCMRMESLSNHPETYASEAIMESCDEQHLDSNSEDAIYLVGGFDGKSWLSSLDSYSPSKDVLRSLKPMSLVRSYTSVAKLNGDLYVIGGGNDSLWYDTVESYNPANDIWTSLPCLNGKKGSLGAASLHDKTFAIGGGNGLDCFSDVEMLDLDVGRWISARSMLQKRFALAAAELNGALYAVGGFDGNDYLRSAERFDPREHSWGKLENMNIKRGCHSLVILNEKLYAIGGWDGSAMVPNVEVFDPRYGRWVIEAPMNHARGYSAAVVLSDTLYVIGGVEGDEKIVEKVEQYKDGHGWQLTNLKAVGKRCFASAITL